jgi:hypothetical protein
LPTFAFEGLPIPLVCQLPLPLPVNKGVLYHQGVTVGKLSGGILKIWINRHRIIGRQNVSGSVVNQDQATTIFANKNGEADDKDDQGLTLFEDEPINHGEKEHFQSSHFRFDQNIQPVVSW